METPNTRYRRKREDENATGTPRASGSGTGSSGSQDTDRVIWVHDQRLKRAVQMATEHVELAPPTPTQKPRSICTRPTTNSSNSSSRPPRKRPCRPSRSVPTSGSGIIRPDAGSSSAPSASGRVEGEVRLELLLQQFELLSAPPQLNEVESVVTPAGKGKGRRDVESPITRSTITARIKAGPRIHMDMDAKDSVPTSIERPDRPTTKPIAPSPLSTKQTNTSTRQNTTTQSHKTHPKPFKTPFLNLDQTKPNIRSSPRRMIPPSPLRAVQAETPLRRGVVRKHNANVDIGEDEPEGNDSFDSFDGMFQEGGPEVEELFRRIDGS